MNCRYGRRSRRSRSVRAASGITLAGFKRAAHPGVRLHAVIGNILANTYMIEHPQLGVGTQVDFQRRFGKSPVRLFKSTTSAAAILQQLAGDSAADAGAHNGNAKVADRGHRLPLGCADSRQRMRRLIVRTHMTGCCQSDVELTVPLALGQTGIDGSFEYKRSLPARGGCHVGDDCDSVPHR